MVLSIIYATYKAVLARWFNFMQHMFTNTTGAVYSYTLSTSGLDHTFTIKSAHFRTWTLIINKQKIKPVHTGCRQRTRANWEKC